MARLRERSTLGVEDLPATLHPALLDVWASPEDDPDSVMRRYGAMIRQMSARDAWADEHGVRRSDVVHWVRPEWFGQRTFGERGEA